MKKTRWTELTSEDKELIINTYKLKATHKERVSKLAKKYNISNRTVRDWWQRLGITEGASGLPAQLAIARKNKIDKDTRILLISTAQNKTAVHGQMLESMLTYKDFLEKEKGFKTQIIITPTRYRNPSGVEHAEQLKADDWWDKKVLPYLFYDTLKFGDTIISAQSRVKPTTKHPLVGFEALAGKHHLILGSPKADSAPLPRFRGEAIKTMSTTGACTFRNYSDSKIGEHGDIHHVYGFVVVELREDGTCMIPRFVTCKDDGSFYDLNYKVEGQKVSKVERFDTLIWGDIHAEQLDQEIYTNTLSIFKGRVDTHILHDVLDGNRFNPHEEKDLYIRRRKIVNNKYDIKEEINAAVAFPKQVYKDFGGIVLVVESNHDVFLDRYINNKNWKNDLHNSHHYLEYAYIQQTQDLTKHGNLFGYLLHKATHSEPIQYIPYGTLVEKKGILVSTHGDYGVNGSRGNLRQIAKLNRKSVTGHSHTHMIKGSAWSTGVTCKLEQYYNRKGLSTWTQGHTLIHENGKRQQVVFTLDKKVSILL